jgi:plasmid stabilization system protein ParE
MQTMNYRVIVKRLASRDLQAALEYYAVIRENLKDDLLVEVSKVFMLLEENPMRRASDLNGIYQIAINRFPYIISYVIEGNQVFIIAILHERRRPTFRTTRLEQDGQ